MTRPPSSPGRVHIIGAGLAGLAAATDLVDRGYPVVLYESAAHAGGRCRSFFDAELGARIDNGNHLLLSGNTAALKYIARIGAVDTFEPPGEAMIPFVDLATGDRWSVQPSRGRVPWWVLRAARRVPGTRARDYLAGLRLRGAAAEATVAALLAHEGTLYRRLWQPLTVAALNTATAEASARLLWRIVADTLGRGAAACRSLIPREGLSESLVDPALGFLARHDAEIRLSTRLRAVGHNGARVDELAFDNHTVRLAPEDMAILAVPAAVAARLVPGLVVPEDYAPIVNAHFRHTAPADRPSFLGVVGGTAEWVFRKRQIVSVTVSAADRLVDLPMDELGELLWGDVVRAYALPKSRLPPARIVKERRATFRATPAQLRRRPFPATQWNNFHLAGDYVETGLPATIEGAIRSGFAAAARVRRDPAAAYASNPPSKPFATYIEDCRRALP